MAGRCAGCSSNNATGASLQAGSDCVSVTGAGTPASPAVIDVVIDPDAANNLQCGTDGLFAASSRVEAADESVVVTGDGSLATPYEVAAQISETAGNLLQLEADGLYARQNPAIIQGAATLFGGALPADPNWVIEAGTYVGTSDASGHITIPINSDLAGILTIDPYLGDRPLTHTEMNLDMGSVSLVSFDVVVEDAEAYGTPIVAGTYRINYTLIGWTA